MAAVIEYLREFHILSVVVRMLLATLCGCALGFGRASKNRNAGLRTYMLVSIGSALTMMISVYEYEMLKGQWAWVSELTAVKFDGTRFSAQLIAGIGFLAAGTILSVGHQQISGLTTAIGLVASAALDHVLRDCKDNRFAISNLQVTGIYDLDTPVYTAMISLRSRKFTTIETLLHSIEETEGVLTAEAVEV